MLQQNVDSNNKIDKRKNASNVKMKHSDPAEHFQGNKYLATPQ